MARLGDEGGGDERREAFAVGHDGVGRLGREVLQQAEALQDAAQFVEERVQTCREGRLLVGGNDLSHHPVVALNHLVEHSAVAVVGRGGHPAQADEGVSDAAQRRYHHDDRAVGALDDAAHVEDVL